MGMTRRRTFASLIFLSSRSPSYPRPSRDQPDESLVIGYGTPPEHAYTAALARLDAVLSQTD